MKEHSMLRVRYLLYLRRYRLKWFAEGMKLTGKRLFNCCRPSTPVFVQDPYPTFESNPDADSRSCRELFFLQ
jgi:hypothetical protein